MQNIDDAVMEQLEILAQLALEPEERARMKAGVQQMVDYVGKLDELDTGEVLPASHIFPLQNVFREDREENPDAQEEMLQNAPVKKEGQYQVPKTV